MNGLGDVFMQGVECHPGRPALWSEGTFYSYEELFRRAMNVLAGLRRVLPETTGNRLAVLGGRETDSYIGLLAAALGGMAYVPLNPRFPAERNARIVGAAEPAALYIAPGNEKLAESILKSNPGLRIAILADPAMKVDFGPGIAVLRGSDLTGGESRKPAGVAPDDGAYLMFTSGSTGEPKGVLINNRNVMTYLGHMRRILELSETDRFTQLFDLTFDLSVHDMFVCWGVGATLFAVPQMATLAAGRMVQEFEITHWFSVPSLAGQLKQIGAVAPGLYPSLRHSLFCGEGLPSSLARDWQAAAPNSLLRNLYGPTEATIAFTQYVWDPVRDAGMTGLVPIGHPFPGLGVGVVDGDSRKAGSGQSGELCLRGDQVVAGYWRDPEQTARRFVEFDWDRTGRYYRTGDVVHQDEDAGLVFHGRVDHQLKIRGFRVEAHEIETVIRAVAGTDLVAVIGWPANGGNTAYLGTAAFVVGGNAPAEAIVESCKAKLPDYMVPSHVFFLGEMPYNANGKIDYGALSRMAGK